MTVAREPEVEREPRQVVGLPKLHERSSQSKLRQVSVQGNAFNAPERVGEVRRRRTNRSRDVDESNRAGQVRFEELLRAADQSTRRPARLAGSTVSVERGTKERDHPLLEIGFVPIRRRGTLQKTSTH